MRLNEISLIRSSLPLKKPFTTALRSVSHITELLLILETKTGLHGLGSAPDTQAITGDTIMRIEHEIREIVEPAFLDYPLEDYQTTFEKLAQLPLSGSTQALMDIALHDLFAKEARKPLYAYLKGEIRPLQTLYTISIDTPEAMFMQAYEAQKSGFKALKIKLDASLQSNISRLQSIGTLEGCSYYLDPNQALNLEDTIALLDAVKTLPIVLIEQPLPKTALEEMQKLKALSPVSLLADESLFSLEDAKKLYDRGACDAFNIKLMKCGGIYQARKILEFATRHQIPCMMGSMLESSVSITAALHLCYAYDIITYVDLDGPTLANRTMGDGGISYQGSHIALQTPSDEGLGIIF